MAVRPMDDYACYFARLNQFCCAIVCQLLHLCPRRHAPGAAPVHTGCIIPGSGDVRADIHELLLLRDIELIVIVVAAADFTGLCIPFYVRLLGLSPFIVIAQLFRAFCSETAAGPECAAWQTEVDKVGVLVIRAGAHLFEYIFHGVFLLLALLDLRLAFELDVRIQFDSPLGFIIVVSIADVGVCLAAEVGAGVFSCSLFRILLLLFLISLVEIFPAVADDDALLWCGDAAAAQVVGRC